MVLWRCQWREGTGEKVGNIVFPVFCPPNSIVHALPQTLSPCLCHEINLSPGISCLTAAWREISASSAAKALDCSSRVLPKGELPAFPGPGSNMLPTLPGAVPLHGGSCWPVLPLARRAWKTWASSDPAWQNPHQNLQTTFSLFLKMDVYQDKHCIFRKTWQLRVKAEAL